MSDEDDAFDQDDDEELEADGDAGADIDADDAIDAVEEDDVDEDATVAKPVSRAARDEAPEAHSVEARAKVRDSLAADVEAFLARGGSIKEIADEPSAASEKKSGSSYRRGSI